MHNWNNAKKKKKRVPQPRIAEMTRLNCQFIKITKKKVKNTKNQCLNLCWCSLFGVLWVLLLMQCKIYIRFYFEPVSDKYVFVWSHLHIWHCTNLNATSHTNLSIIFSIMWSLNDFVLFSPWTNNNTVLARRPIYLMISVSIFLVAH